jgi:spermidine/putrescine ABC transporter ATP-binding subunit
MMKGATIIALRSLSKNFGPVRALEEVSFEVKRGEFFSILGPSGCGKTTLLRILAGFERPDGGNVVIDGQPMHGVPAHERPTNMVFQSYAIFPHLNVRDNIAYGLRRRKLAREELEERVAKALDLIKLPGYGRRSAHELSGGERQRVALARALVCEPKVLLLDEPLGALDKKLREDMQIELRQLQRTVGVTFVFVTHDQEEALTMSDRIAVMAKGRILQIDSAARLYEAPNCREVAGFIGTMNFFHGRLTGRPHGQASVDAGALGTLHVAAAGNLPDIGTVVTVAIRPEKFSLSRQPVDAQNAIAGQVSAEAYFGNRSHYYVRVSGIDRLIAVARQNAERSLDDPSAIGKTVWISFPPEAAILLTS